MKYIREEYSSCTFLRQCVGVIVFKRDKLVSMNLATALKKSQEESCTLMTAAKSNYYAILGRYIAKSFTPLLFLFIVCPIYPVSNYLTISGYSTSEYIIQQLKRGVHRLIQHLHDDLSYFYQLLCMGMYACMTELKYIILRSYCVNRRKLSFRNYCS